MVLCVSAVPSLTQAQVVRAAVRDKAVETIQLTDDMELPEPELTYTLERLDAQRSMNALWRAVISLPERQAATDVSAYLERKHTCRIEYKAGQYDRSKQCADEAQEARNAALKALGLTKEQVYPRVRAAGD